MNITIKRTDEVELIKLGVGLLISDYITSKRKTKPAKKSKVGKKKWTKQQHKKYAETMARKWGAKKGKP